MRQTTHFTIYGIISFIYLFGFQLQAQNLTLGAGAGASIVGGNQNTLLGVNAGNAITNGSKNTLIGFDAGLLNTASDNTFLGYNAGKENTTGNYNTFLGINAGLHNKAGFSNTYVGRSAGVFDDGGAYNTFVGELSGAFSGGTAENTFVGYRAGHKTDYGGANSFFGAMAGENNTDGQENTFIGDEAGHNNTKGNLNTYVGRSSGSKNTVGSINVALGYWAGMRSISGWGNTSIGTMAGEWNVRGEYNTYVGQRSGGGMNVDNSYATSLGSKARVKGSYSTAIGRNAFVHGSHRLVLGATAGYNYSEHNTFVGIGKVTPNYLLHLGDDDAAKPGSNVWTIASDLNLKKNIYPFTDGLEIIEQINPVRFTYNGKAEMPTDKEYVGIIAQEMQDIAPYMVGQSIYEDTTGRKESYLDYDGNAMTYILINAVKELKMQNDALKEELQRLAEYVEAEVGSEKSLMQGASSAKLWQNFPNPAKGETTIRYQIPFEVSEARIRLSTTQGQMMKEWLISKRGKGHLNVNGKELPAGPYLYQLIIDGKIIESKWMILNH